MPVLAVFRWEGDPDALIAAYDRELQHSVPREQPRRVTHICARGADEVVIVDIWRLRRTSGACRTTRSSCGTSKLRASHRIRPRRSTRCMRPSRERSRRSALGPHATEPLSLPAIRSSTCAFSALTLALWASRSSLEGIGSWT
jgi:hypothetical protein